VTRVEKLVSPKGSREVWGRTPRKRQIEGNYAIDKPHGKEQKRRGAGGGMRGEGKGGIAYRFYS